MRTAAFFDAPLLAAASAGMLFMPSLLQRRHAQPHRWPIMLDGRWPGAAVTDVGP